MKRLYKALAIILCAALPFASCGKPAERPDAALHGEGDAGYIPCAAEVFDFDIRAPQAFVYDLVGGRYVYLSGHEKILYPASTTKLLTILYALTLLSPHTLVTPGDELALCGEGSSVAYIKTHHTLTVEMLVEGMLLPSGNDAAYALAAAGGRALAGGAEMSGVEATEAFIAGMNAYAKELGVCGSNFISPDGFYSESHYSTIEDMAIISLNAAQNALIMKYARLPFDNVTYASGHTNTWINTNLMLDPASEYYSEYITGLKTGSAGEGNYSLICTAEKGGREYIIGVFSERSGADRFSDIKAILDKLYGDK